MERIEDILARIFTDPTPCTGCARPVPTYRDRETGCCYCPTCLETAVTEAEAELQAERQDTARLCACYGHLAL